MQIVIEIPENRWKEIQHTATTDTDSMNWYERKISEGTPLPEHHGRLIDADALVPDCQEQSIYYDDDEHNVYTAVRISQIEFAPTIVEADKTESEGEE